MNHITLRRRATKSLPYDAEVEYLRVTNNATFLIQSQIKMKKGMGFGITFSDFTFYRTNGSCPLCGTNWSTTSRAMFFCAPPKGVVTNLDWINSSSLVADVSGSGKKTLELKNYNGSTCKVYLNNVGKATRTYFDFETGNNMRIQFLSLGDSRYDGKIYNAFIYNSNNDRILDLIPVRKGQVGYMYDKVSGQLFGNGGTGNFILGPDK